MAAVSITAANVIQGSKARTELHTSGAPITAGQACYIDPTTKNLLLSQANGSANARKCDGIALNSGASGQPILLNKLDAAFVCGGTLVSGQSYYVSETAGGLDVFADLTSTDTAIWLGVAVSTTVLNLSPMLGGTV